jgi:hypothetical protein
MGDVGRNLLHNPLFNVAQRGAGPWTVGGYGLDRWQGAVSGDTYTMSQGGITDAQRAQIGDEAANVYLANTFTGTSGAGALTVIWQPIEDVRRLANKTVTVSFWAIAGTAIKLGVSFDQSFGSGGSPSATVSSNGQSVTLSSTWTRYSLTFTLPSVSGKVLGTTANTSSTSMFFWYSSGSTNNVRSGSVGVQSGTVNIWGVQLEIGSVATPLEKPDPRYDLANCQRFYQIVGITFGSYQLAANYIYTPIIFPVTMRATPSFILSNVTNTNCTGPIAYSPTPQGTAIYIIATASGAASSQFNLAISADL